MYKFCLFLSTLLISFIALVHLGSPSFPSTNNGRGKINLLLMTCDTPSHLKRIIYHHDWDRNFPNLEGKGLDVSLKKLDQELSDNYPKQTTVSLIDYYSSNNMAKLATFIKINSFSIFHVSYQDPATVYSEGNYN